MKVLKPLSTIFLFVFLLICTSGCVFTSSRLNREEDKQDAEKVTNKFYSMIRSKNYDSGYDLFSDKFWAVTSVKRMNALYTATQKKCGDLVSIKLGDWQTKVVSGTDPSAEYQLTYNNHYQKYDAKESFILMKDDDGKIRIINYNINSDAFLK
jgi:hypothetical protein